ncbi:unnamed protein product [Schistosoma curassoni]|nr:unnamed protein product [Schistosoma curassoni]
MALNAESSLSHNTGVKTLYESDLEDENYSSVESYGIRERRRKLHTEAEQRRRNAIKRGFEGLLELVHPMKNESPSPSVRMSKSSILHKAIYMIERLGRQKHQKLSEVESLEKEVKALRILCLNYEKIVQNSPNYECRSVEPIPDDTKLEVFRVFFDAMFRSFDNYIVFNSFTDLSASVIKWVEESCKPEKMAFLMDSVLTNIFNQNTEMPSVSSRKLHCDTLPIYTDCSTNDSQNPSESIGSIHPSTESLLQINPLIGQSSVYTYSSNSLPTLTIAPTTNINNSTVSTEKRTQLNPKFPIISQGNSHSNKLNIIGCPPPPPLVPGSVTTHAQVSLIDVNFQQCGQPSKDIREGDNAFYNFNSMIPKNVNSTLVVIDQSSLLTDDQVKHDIKSTSSSSSSSSPHTINSSCNLIMNEMNLPRELSSLHNSSHVQQYKEFIDDLL